MAKFKIIPIDLYKRDITVFVGSHDEFKEWVASYNVPASWEQLIESIVLSEDDAVASYWYNRNNGNGIIELPCHPKSKEEIGVAAHECLHCVMHTLSYINIPCIPHEANEAYTYLLEHILVNVLDYNNYELINI
ncbi:MAG: hypothetical protein [crAssphage sp. isolate ctcc615]|uniref:IrrE N-terminal-like domain-containing protein n=1 Tax=crAssphage sp. isolate ctcc615 TaxID=2989853 RepID=A0A345BNX9_9CAUD|nr:MAG: hypothetical protein KNU00_gp53 [crAssphage sp. isolate ctcc615]AXF52150.1 MAG: hypothetical protein [crAssphage sp. isolate ctcc615]